MKKLSDITSKFKNTKFRVSMVGEASADAQKAMFAMGFRWMSTESGEVREVRRVTAHAFYLDADLRIMLSTLPGTFSRETDFKEIGIIELFNASKEFKALEKALRKARKFEKKLAAVAIAAGYTPNTGVCPDGEVDSVIFADGQEWEYDVASYAIPYEPNLDATIAGYKLKQPESRVVSHEEMVATIVADAGGFIAWDGTGHDWRFGYGEAGPVAVGTLIDVKCRDCVVQGRMAAGKTVYDGGRYPAGAFWSNDGADADIVGYRLSQPASTFEKAVVEPLKSFGDISDSRCNDATDNPCAAAEFAPDTNPKKQYGLASIPLNLWSPLASAYGALSLYNGSLKYGRGNFKATPVEASIYIAAAFRHLTAWAEGEEFDPADGCPNLGGVLANIAILLEARAVGTLIDDRGLPGGYLQEREALKRLVTSLQAVHAGKDPRHYTIADAK